LLRSYLYIPWKDMLATYGFFNFLGNEGSFASTVTIVLELDYFMTMVLLGRINWL